jgi:hypothetical protein
MLIRCYLSIIVMVDTIYSTSSRNLLKFLSTFGTVHHVLLQHLDFYSDHAMFFLAHVWGDTWKFHLSPLLCIVYICVCIYFWLISFYLWLVLIFFFNKVYYGFTPLPHRTLGQISKKLRYLPHIFDGYQKWYSMNITKVISRLISKVSDIIHCDVQHLDIHKLYWISKMLISGLDIKSRAEYQC